MEIIYTKTYQEYKADLDAELSKTAEGFVRIGYLLKVARDTDVLTQSPYQTVTEFAKAEYGIDKSMVSRFININDRFSEGGYSDQLLEQYRGYGYAKLTLMLSLPDEINQELSPAYSKADIQAIKDEMNAEKAITDLEVMMEAGPEQAGGRALGQAPGQPTDENLLEALVRQLGEDSPELYVQMAALVNLDNHMEWTKKAMEAMAPDGEKQYSIRISGKGRYLMSIRETEHTITITALRTLEKETHAYHTLRRAWAEILPVIAGTKKENEEAWEIVYEKEYPGKARVAPVQQPAKPKKTESKPIPRKASKVQKAPKPGPAKAEPPKKDNTPAPEPEKPGSTGTGPQTGMEAAGSENVANCHELPENPIKTGTEQPGEQLSGQIGIKEAIEETEEGSRGVSYIEPHTPQTAAGQELALDKKWENEKEELFDDLKRMNTEGSLLNRNLSQIPYVHIVSLREILINMAALIEEELLRRGESF